MSIDFAFQRGTQTLHLTSEPLQPSAGPRGYFQALTVDASVEGLADEHFLYFGPLRFCLRTPEGPVVGFQLVDLLAFEPEAYPDAAFGPRFDVPEFGLTQAHVGDIVRVARATFIAMTQGAAHMTRLPKAPIHLDDDTLHLGPNLAVSFQRTLRIPDDGGEYPLPPGLGTFPLRRVADYAGRVPDSWRERGGIFMPMYQREAMWLSFSGEWPPVALKVGVGGVDAITGEAWTDTLDGTEQNYVVCPDQPWLDGINSGHGTIRQFVAMPLRAGYTVEGQLTGREAVGGLQLMAFEARPDRLPARPQEVVDVCMAASAMEMGLGAGGRMTQDIYPDDYGIDTWEPGHNARVFVHLADSLAWREITGEEPPPTPVTARTYAEHGLPWYSLYDEGRGDVAPGERLGKVKGIREMDARKGCGTLQDDRPVEISEPHIVELGGPAGS